MTPVLEFYRSSNLKAGLLRHWQKCLICTDVCQMLHIF
ncbi:hypothetical protein CPter91_2635 [Collimonas pratensis]|uniref:Uncharacterized protein n=1 Tax=Collimonas pratensis TaxID=279113 RepID=A0A127Q5A2_9BURK|nr:hypothetical protein CPter91_2635 [Collimonas pratensis]